ncbi:hypothetical protein HK096_008740 [Nowakowskiella sp. JEL0078]|nr:hypothetical protein HK096_008740 [Nowakowskiella sp. JEL0078]
MGAGGHDPKSHGSPAQILASGTSGFLELLIFHPIDTVGKRLINHRGSAIGSTTSQTMSNLRSIIFRDVQSKSILSKYASLFPGFKFAVLYKVSQRTYQFGGHPIVAKYITNTELGNYVKDRYGNRKGRTIIHALSGSIIGIGEVSLLPFDALKVKSQTASKTLSSNSVSKSIKSSASIPIQTLSSTSAFSTHSTISATKTSQTILSPNLGFFVNTIALYRGASWTAARNSIGCVALFGTSAMVKDMVFNVDEEKVRATIFQTFVASVSGAVASILIASPLDVIKVRVQAAPNDRPLKGIEVLRTLIRNEGAFALYKGIVPKLLVASPKISFTFFLSSQLAPFLAKYLGL